jgi:hypothetical protein
MFTILMIRLVCGFTEQMMERMRSPSFSPNLDLTEFDWNVFGLGREESLSKKLCTSRRYWTFRALTQFIKKENPYMKRFSNYDYNHDNGENDEKDSESS